MTRPYGSKYSEEFEKRLRRDNIMVILVASILIILIFYFFHRKDQSQENGINVNCTLGDRVISNKQMSIYAYNFDEPIKDIYVKIHQYLRLKNKYTPPDCLEVENQVKDNLIKEKELANSELKRLLKVETNPRQISWITNRIQENEKAIQAYKEFNHFNR
jgi:hypothetical protein